MKYHDAIKLEAGEDVTVLVKGALKRGTVDVDVRFGFFSARDFVGNAIDVLFVDTEGTEWCRGHEDPAVEALLAANALT